MSPGNDNGCVPGREPNAGVSTKTESEKNGIEAHLIRGVYLLLELFSQGITLIVSVLFSELKIVDVRPLGNEMTDLTHEYIACDKLESHRITI